VTEPVRVLLLELPPLLRGILEQAMDVHTGCEMVKDSRTVFQMLTEQPASADIVILGLSEAQDATLVPAVFAQWPRAQVMTITQAGNDAAAYELQPLRRALGDMSPTDIVDILRQAVERRRGLSGSGDQR
jgi:DNA-binding NarL/FixJ family response regulator